MPLRRLMKRPKITNLQMLMMKRREPYKPEMKERHEIENRVKWDSFERKNSEGLVFVPDRQLPPWQKTLALNASRTHSRMNFRGFRVRHADKQDEPGFPTPFRSIIDQYASDLFDVVELNGENIVSFTSAVETLRLVNTALSHEYAVALVNHAKPYDGRGLDRSAFATAVRYALQNTESRDAVLVLRELISRLRLSYRKKFLMMDVRVNTPPASVAENPTAVALFRELFDTEAHGASHITRAQLRQLISAILPDDPGVAANCAKAALSEDDSDMISFFEFMTVAQPVTQRLPLSDLMEQMRHRRRPASSSSPAPPVSLLTDAEMELHRRRDAAARRHFALTPAGAPLAAHRIAAPGPPERDARDGPGAGAGAGAAALEGELVRLRRENEQLRRDLLQLQTRGPSVRIEEGDRIIEMRGEDFFNEENESLREKLAVTKEALRVCQSKLDIYEDISCANSELRLGLFPKESTHAVYPEEFALAARYKKLVHLVERQREAFGRPAQLFLSQMDVIAQGYQGLYRRLRGSVDGTGASTSTLRAQSIKNASQIRRKPWVD